MTPEMEHREKQFRQQEFERYRVLVEGVDDPVLLVLRVHLLIEGFLERLIAGFLPRGDDLLSKGRLTFANKLDLVASFDVVDDDLVSAARHLNRVRNTIAHDIDKTITLSDVDLIGRSLGKLFIQTRHEYGGNTKVLLHQTLMLITVGYAKNIWWFESDFIEGKSSDES